MASYSMVLMFFEQWPSNYLNSILFPFKPSLQMYTTFLAISKSKAMVLCCNLTIPKCSVYRLEMENRVRWGLARSFNPFPFSRVN